jgi:hypothetical protein
MEDVNQGAPSQDTSSVSEGNIETPSQSPAEAQNTGDEWQPEKNARFVPYDRFSEVIQDRNQLREKNKLYEGKDELLKTYESFDNVLNQNPELFNAIMYLLQGGNQEQAQQTQNQQMDTTQQLAMDNYMGRFNQFCSENKIAQEMAPYVYQLAESFFLKINPDPLRNYNPQALNQALMHTKKFLDTIGNANLAGYVQSKTKDSVPTSASTGGSPPSPAPRPLNSQQDRAAAMAEMMRAGNF